MAVNYSNHNISTSGLITATSGNFTDNLTVNNNVVWHSGNFDNSNIVRTTGTQTINGSKTFGNQTSFTSGIITSNISSGGDLILNSVDLIELDMSNGAEGGAIGIVYDIANKNQQFQIFDSASDNAILVVTDRTSIVCPNTESSGTYFPVFIQNPNAGTSAILSRTASQLKGDIGLGNVSISGHSHSSSDITNFNSSVSGLIPTTLVHTTGNQSVSGVKIFNNIAINESPLGSPYPFYIKPTNNSFSQSSFVIQEGSTPTNTILDIRNDGNIGIGYSAMGYSARLSIAGKTSDASASALDVFSSGSSSYLFRVRNDGNVGIRTASPTAQLHVLGSGIFASGLSVTGLLTGNSGNFTSSLQLNGSGVGLYDTSVFNLGTISGSNAINCGQDRQIQTLTLNGTATTLTKGTNWPSSSSVSREVTLNIYSSSNTSVTWSVVTDWYRQPDSPLPSGNHIVLLRGVGSSIVQGHYIGSKTN